MIRKLEITGVHIETDEKLKKYVQKSVAKLERYMPRHERASAHVDVKLSESKKQQDKQRTAEIIVHLPHDKLTAKESTVNLYAAIDIVEAKLRNQIKKHKDMHTNPKFYRRLTSKFRRANVNQV